MNTIERRKFIKQSMLGTLGLGVSSNIPLFLSNSLKAQTVIAQGVPNMLDAAKSHKILVLLQLEGGNDGLNTVIPYEDKKYYKARKTISVKEAQALKLEPIKSVEQSENKEAKKSKGSALGLHPEMTFFAEMYKEGQLAVINNVGYEKPNRSHFKSGAIWQSGLEDVGWSSEAEIEENTGWLGRYFDAHCAGENNFVGELALLYHAPRSATIIAKGEVTSWSLDRTTFKTILQDANTQKGDKHTAFLDQVRSELLCMSLPRLVATRLRTPRSASPEDYGSLQIERLIMFLPSLRCPF